MQSAIDLEVNDEGFENMTKMVCSTHDHTGFEIYQKHSALTASQFLHEYKKTPSSMQVQPYIAGTQSGPVVYFLVRRTSEMKYKYPTIKIFHGSTDDVATSPNDSLGRTSACMEHNFMALQGMHQVRSSQKHFADELKGAQFGIPVNTPVTSHANLCSRATTLENDSNLQRTASIPRDDNTPFDDEDPLLAIIAQDTRGLQNR